MLTLGINLSCQEGPLHPELSCQPRNSYFKFSIWGNPNAFQFLPELMFKNQFSSLCSNCIFYFTCKMAKHLQTGSHGQLQTSFIHLCNRLSGITWVASKRPLPCSLKEKCLFCVFPTMLWKQSSDTLLSWHLQQIFKEESREEGRTFTVLVWRWASRILAVCRVSAIQSGRNPQGRFGSADASWKLFNN